MADPTHADALRLLKVPAAALTEVDFQGYLTDVKEILTTGETDRLTLLYGTLWSIAKSHSWSYLTRIGDKSFDPPNPEVWRGEYLRRCNQRKVKPVLLGRVKLAKVNSALDDDTDLNLSS